MAIDAAEAIRLATLHDHALLDTPPEPAFDAIVCAAADSTAAQAAMISLVDHTRQWFKAKVGTDDREHPIDQSICAHAIRGNGVFVVPDASADARFRDFPAVRADDGIRFYAGVPLVMTNGATLGTLCIVDVEAREALTEGEREALEVLARRTVAAFELRRAFHAQGQGAPADTHHLLDAATALLDRAAVLLERAGATGPLAHLETVIATVDGYRLA